MISVPLHYSLQITKTRESVVEFMRLTLFGVQTQESEQDLSEFTNNSLQQLIELELVKEITETDSGNRKQLLDTTKLGQAAFKGNCVGIAILIDLFPLSDVIRQVQHVCI